MARRLRKQLQVFCIQFRTKTSHAHADADADVPVDGKKHVRDSRSKSAKRFKSHLPKRSATARTLLRTVIPGGTTLHPVYRVSNE